MIIELGWDITTGIIVLLSVVLTFLMFKYAGKVLNNDAYDSWRADNPD